MKTNILQKIIATNDATIRSALKKELGNRHAKDEKIRIVEELGIRHGIARIDIAVINGFMHGYEIKSDRDTLKRLPEQMTEFNTVFDRITLVVGKQHLYQAINMIPAWWGIIIAKIDTNTRVVFQTIREPEDNKEQKGISIAQLLWKEEALQILEEYNQADGVRSKPREFIYERITEKLDIEVLKSRVRKILLAPRKDWRFGLSPISSGD